MKIINSKRIIPSLFALLFAMAVLMAGCSNMIVDLTGTGTGTSGDDTSENNDSETTDTIGSAHLTGIAASLVLGQPDFTTGTAPAAGPTADNFKKPYGLLITGGKLYITSTDQNRVLGYSTVPTITGTSADFVLGQTNLTSQVDTTTSTGFTYPFGITTDGTKLIVADNSNNRILIWNSLPTTTATAADVVVGQADMTSNESAVSATRFQPFGVAVGGGKMVVTDALSNRILLYNSIPATNDAPANFVLGQTDFASSGVGTTASGLQSPRGAWTNGDMIIIADIDNNRVLIWNSWPTSNGQAADVVIGQIDFTSDISTCSSTGMRSPTEIAVGGGRLFISEWGNHRILVYDAIPTSNGAAADAVIGQSDFTTDSSGTTASKLYNPAGLTVSGSSLWVADYWNNRVLCFDLEE